MALAGVRVIELAGLAPAPFCGMILADFGAKVIRVDRTKVAMSVDTQARGKKSVAINLKTSEGAAVLKKLCLHSDVVLEPYRKGQDRSIALGARPCSCFTWGRVKDNNSSRRALSRALNAMAPRRSGCCLRAQKHVQRQSRKHRMALDHTSLGAAHEEAISLCCCPREAVSPVT